MAEFELDILLATYNGEKYISSQIESLINQITDVNFRILISDDGSRDNTVQIIKNYANNSSVPIIVLESNSSNLGPCGRFEYLIRNSEAPYVMLCDQDDYWLPNKVELSLKCLKSLEEGWLNTPIAVFTDLYVVDNNLNIVENSMMQSRGISNQPSRKSLLINNIATGCTMALNRRLVQISLPFPKEVYMHDWWLALLASQCGKLAFLNFSSIYYRQHESNTLGFAKDDILNKILRIPKILYSRTYDRIFSQAHALERRLIETNCLTYANEVELLCSYKDRNPLLKRIIVSRYLRSRGGIDVIDCDS